MKDIYFQRYPRFTSLREAAEPFIRTKREVRKTSLFLCGYRNDIDIPYKPPFAQGRFFLSCKNSLSAIKLSLIQPIFPLGKSGGIYYLCSSNLKIYFR